MGLKWQNIDYQNKQINLRRVWVTIDLRSFDGRPFKGIEKCDAVRLKWGDIDLCKRDILKAAKKNRKTAAIRMHPELFDGLRHEYETRKPQPGDTVLHKSGRPLSAGQLDYRIEEWGKAASVAVHAHRFRHTLRRRWCCVESPSLWLR